MQANNYLEYYTDIVQGNVASSLCPDESKEEIGLVLFERYAETFVLLLKFYKQEFTYEQTHALSLALYNKYRESSIMIDLTCQVEVRRKSIVKAVAYDHPDSVCIEFLQNWSSPAVWRHYKIVYGQLAGEWNLFKNSHADWVEEQNRTPLNKSVYDTLNKLSGISELEFYRES